MILIVIIIRSRLSDSCFDGVGREETSECGVSTIVVGAAQGVVAEFTHELVCMFRLSREEQRFSLGHHKKNQELYARAYFISTMHGADRSSKSRGFRKPKRARGSKDPDALSLLHWVVVVTIPVANC